LRTFRLLALLVATASAVSAQQSTNYPKDINSETYNRFPPVKRADLDDYGKRVFDENVAPNSGRTTLAGGPVALRMLVPEIAEHLHFANQYLRNNAGLTPRYVELTILAAARELDVQYEWSAHEPAALKAGVPQSTIDVVKFRKALTGLPEQDAAIIQLGREAVGGKKVSSETFAKAEKLFGQKGVISMAAIIGEYSAAAILLRVADQQMAPDRKGLLPIP
jgi:4-carboxymuconolactone decarboxylase